MAPSKTTSTKGKKSSKVSKGRQKASQQSTSRISKNKAKALPPKQQKSKAAPAKPKKKKSRIYTDEELGIPKLNMITPVGVQKFRGKKKGKVFVDDPVRTHCLSPSCGKIPRLIRVTTSRKA